MRRAALALTVAATLFAASPAGAQGASGGAEAPETTANAPATGATVQGGARYSAPPKQASKRRARKKTRASRGGAKARGKARRRRPVAKKPKPAPAPAPLPIPTSDHAFPVAGPYSFGGADGRFGAGRKGHIHQGQDITAAEGVPVVAPWAGTVEAVKYQAGGAGHYVVLDGEGEDRDYVFMHLRQGSVIVTRGAVVVKGQQLAQVGNTGSSTGAHLHFEIWVGGGWYTGGQPVDPLPFLQAWLR
ncbi:MAG TPA: M23 family metallopeptidase [Thermoleophilaceae bacterium]|nr:M23 family metallopeptidase [Thermoleophilaceae bacterium]